MNFFRLVNKVQRIQNKQLLNQKAIEMETKKLSEFNRDVLEFMNYIISWNDNRASHET